MLQQSPTLTYLFQFRGCMLHTLKVSSNVKTGFKYMKKKWLRYLMAQEVNIKGCTTSTYSKSFKSFLNNSQKMGFLIYIVNIYLAKKCIIIPCASLVFFFSDERNIRICRLKANRINKIV
jgi:hypothetical protein